MIEGRERHRAGGDSSSRERARTGPKTLTPREPNPRAQRGLVRGRPLMRTATRSGSGSPRPPSPGCARRRPPTADASWSTPSSSGSRRTASSSPASTASRSGSPRPRPGSSARRRPRAGSPRPPSAPNTRRAYSGALRRLDAWLDGRPLEDTTLAAYLGRAPRAPASAATAVAAACFRAPFDGRRTLTGERTVRTLAGYRNRPAAAGEGQARPFGGSEPRRCPRHLPTRPRRRSRGRQVPEEVAGEHGPPRRGAPCAGPTSQGGASCSTLLLGGAAAGRTGSRPWVG